MINKMVTGLTTTLYMMKHHAPPAAELVPYITKDPAKEFPLLGTSLAPILDLVAPKGSAAAVSVGLEAGISELMGAITRRMPVLATPPPKKDQQQPAQPQPEQPAQPPDGGFRYSGDQLRVLQSQNAYASIK